MKRVLVKVESHARYARDIARGVVAFALGAPGWELNYHAGSDALPGVLRRYPEADGVIAQALKPPQIEAVRHAGRPVVLVEQEPVPGLPLVQADNRAVGRLAYDHLASRGFQHFAYWGPSQSSYTHDREAGFFGEARRAGHACYARPHSPFHDAHHYPGTPAPPGSSEAGFIAWLPKPVALFAHNTIAARDLAAACRELGLYVPEEVAILGVDNDDLLCEAGTPMLSAIDQGTRRIGHEAAALLDRLMNGEPPPVAPIRVDAATLIERQSTSAFAIQDPDVVEAARFIREHVADGIGVQDVLAHVPLARRTLEVRFKRLLGRTLHEEILRTRVERAEQLLLNSHLAMPEITERCGFTYPSKFSAVFKRTTGMSPTTYRRRFHVG